MEKKENIIYTDLSSEEVYSWKYLLKNLNLQKINSQFESFKTSCLSYQTTFKRIEDNVNSLFNIDYSGQSFFPHFKHSITSDRGNINNPYYFFRIRKIEKRYSSDRNNLNILLPETLEFEDIQTLSDVWERPANQVKHYQRLSKPLNSVLYTSLMTSTAILETNINEKDLFFLIVYKSKKEFKYSDCCNFVYYNNLSEDENMKRYTIFHLLRSEFTRVLPNGYNYENQYCAAESISKKFFISDNVDGIQYPSTKGLGHNNFAFWSNTARDCLDFIGLRCCIMGNKNKLSIYADCFWNDSLLKFEYYSPQSERSKLVFGNPLLNTFISK